MPVADIRGSELEVLTVKMGDGGDEANVSQLLGTALIILGEGGDDEIAHRGHLSSTIIPVNVTGIFDLGPGHDRFFVVGTSSSENYDIRPAPDQRVPDPVIRVTDLSTGVEIAHCQVQQA